MRYATFLGVWSLVLLGCQITPSFETGFTAQADPGLAGLKSDVTVTVAELEDARPPKYCASTAKLFLLYIPIIPYVNISYERMDEVVDQISASIAQHGRGITLGAQQPPAPPLAETRYPLTMARTLADDLGRYVRSAACAPAGAPAGASDYVLKGRLKRAPIWNWVTSYCMGMPGVLLWLFPVPVGGAEAEVDIDLVLEKAGGAKVWEGTLRGSASRLVMMYTSAMIYGRAGAFSMNVYPCNATESVVPRSLFAWSFAALEDGWIKVRPDILNAIKADRATR